MEENKTVSLVKDGPSSKDFAATLINSITLVAALLTIAPYVCAQLSNSPAARIAPISPPPAAAPIAIPPEATAVKPVQQNDNKEFVLENTEFHAQISGYVAKVTVKQRFKNPNPRPVDATYSFPLSDSGAIEEMNMKVGKRVIQAEIKEKQEAKAIYEKARASGQAAALLQQVRTNIFTESVANIEPGQPVDVSITYTELLPFAQGKYSLVLPTKVGPRFTPDNLQGEAAMAASQSRSFPVHVNVSMNEGGLPITNIASPLQKLDILKQDGSHATIAYNSDNSDGKDIVINWAVLSDEMQSSYLAHRDGKTGFVTAMILPPKTVTPSQAAPKEMLFIIDCSGSQSGAPIQKAKETLNYIVEHMNEQDTFQIIAFNNVVRKNSNLPVSASAQTKEQAHEFINRLEADGGTMMAPAIAQACNIPTSEGRLRIVTLMTDGFIDNDYNILQMVQKLSKNSRWFPFGTGNNVNRTLIDCIAREGGGEPEYVLLSSPGDQVGKHFYDRIAAPVLTNVHVKFEGVEVLHVYPLKPGDVWDRRPLYFQATYDEPGSGTMIIQGLSQGKPYEQRLAITLPAREKANASLAQVWARGRIDELMSQDWLGMQSGSPTPDIKQEIISTSLQYHVLSQFTSFVAVDTNSRSSTATAEVRSADSDQTESNSAGGNYTGAQTMTGSAAAPMLQGAINGTIGPQGNDVTIIQGINTCGAVRVNNLANIEAFLNIVANLLEIVGVIYGVRTMLLALMEHLCKKPGVARKMLAGAAALGFGLAIPTWVNWLVTWTRDANLLS